MTRRGNEREGRDDRANRRGEGRSAYHSIIGDLTEVSPRDFTTAQAIVARIGQAIALGGWTRNEWRRLHRLNLTWRRRAEGLDPRFNVVGTRKTGLSEEQRRQIKLIKDLRFYPHQNLIDDIEEAS